MRFVKFVKKRKLNILASVAAIVFMWLIWLIAYYAEGNDLVIPSFSATMKSLGALLVSAKFYRALGYTMLTALASFVISYFLAGICAAAATLSKFAREFLKPVIGFLRTLPTLAVVLVLLIWTSPRSAPIIVTVLVLFPIVYAELTASIDGIGGDIKEMCSLYKVPPRDRLFKVYLPLAAPPVLAQTGANYSLGLKVMISAEVLASTRYSYGVMMQTARLYSDIPSLMALTLAAVIIGAVLNIALSQFSRFTDRWTRKEGGDAN